MKNPWTTRSIRTAYENPWIRVTHRDVINPSGGDGIYGVVHFKNLAIGIVPIDSEGYTYLVGQYRYTLDAYHWEIPEGGCPVGTEPLDSAKRELLEETGFSANNWEQLLDFHTSNSVTDEYGIAYLATDLIPGEAQPEETEQLEVRRLPLEAALALVDTGEITDALSVMALQRVALLQLRGKLSF